MTQIRFHLYVLVGDGRPAVFLDRGAAHREVTVQDLGVLGRKLDNDEMGHGDLLGLHVCLYAGLMPVEKLVNTATGVCEN